MVYANKGMKVFHYFCLLLIIFILFNSGRDKYVLDSFMIGLFIIKFDELLREDW